MPEAVRITLCASGGRKPDGHKRKRSDENSSGHRVHVAPSFADRWSAYSLSLRILVTQAALNDAETVRLKFEMGHVRIHNI